MKEKFNSIKEKYPDLSDAMCFVKLVKGKRLARWEIEKWFTELVDRKDYVGTPKEQIISWLQKEIVKK